MQIGNTPFKYHDTSAEDNRDFGEGLTPYLPALPDLHDDGFPAIEDFFHDVHPEVAAAEQHNNSELEQHTEAEPTHNTPLGPNASDPIDRPSHLPLVDEDYFHPTFDGAGDTSPDSTFFSYHSRPRHPRMRDKSMYPSEEPSNTVADRIRYVPLSQGQMYREINEQSDVGTSLTVPRRTARYVWMDEATRIERLSNPWSSFEDHHRPVPPMGYSQAPYQNPFGEYAGRLVPVDDNAERISQSRKRSFRTLYGHDKVTPTKKARFDSPLARERMAPSGRDVNLGDSNVFATPSSAFNGFSSRRFTVNPSSASPYTRPNARVPMNQVGARALLDVPDLEEPDSEEYTYKPMLTGSRGHIPGYPRKETKMPPGLSSEEIITRYPNHLQGDVLLGIAVHWAPTEIERYFGKKDLLKSNTLVKRINSEKIKRGLLPPKAPIPRGSGYHRRLKHEQQQMVKDERYE